MKDLIRYLRRDGEICQIRRILGDARVLQNDLVPMLKQYKDDGVLFDLLVRLLVNLTQALSVLTHKITFVSHLVANAHKLKKWPIACC